MKERVVYSSRRDTEARRKEDRRNGSFYSPFSLQPPATTRSLTVAARIGFTNPRQIGTANLPWLPNACGSDGLGRFGRSGRILLPRPSASGKIEGMSVRQNRLLRRPICASAPYESFHRPLRLRLGANCRRQTASDLVDALWKKYLFLRNEANKSFEINRIVVRQGEIRPPNAKNKATNWSQQVLGVFERENSQERIGAQ